MSVQAQNSEAVVCRLCMSTEPGQLQIFTGDDKNKLCDKIKGCLSIQIYLDDALSKFICQPCVAKIDDIYLYQQSCIHAQTILENKSLKHKTYSEVSEAAIVEAEMIVERLLAEGSALSITPVISSEMRSCEDLQDMLSSTTSGLSIIPIIHSSESSGDEDLKWNSSSTFASIPHLKNPHAEDYILMREETFKVDPSFRFSSKPDAVEYKLRKDDEDVIKTQLMRRVVLPPMWDVYERSADSENITHRRYISSKSSFPCSLCGSCVSFYYQETRDTKNREYEILKNNQPKTPDLQQGHQVDEQEQEQDHQLEPQGVQDLQFRQSTSQETDRLDCPECGKLFPRRSSWKRHVQSHFQGRTLICPLCEKSFNRKEHLARHMLSHSGGRPFCCETCFKPFTRKEHLARHLACNPSCGGANPRLLTRMDQEHAAPRPYICNICFQSFGQKEHMLRHQKQAHLPDRSGASTPSIEDDYVHPYSNCLESFCDEKELHKLTQLNHQSSLNPLNTSDRKRDSTLPNPIRLEDVESPEPIEVEVSLVEDGCDEDSATEGNDLMHIEKVDVKKCAASTSQIKPDADEMELYKEDILRMQMNEAMRKAREGSNSSSGSTPRCEVCQKSFTRSTHLIRHLSRFHPYVELAHAAAHTLGNKYDNSCSVQEAPLLSSHVSVELFRDDENEADNESESTLSSLLSETGSTIPPSKGDQHPCSICGKMFGRRYHLVRHRKTQHGVESVKPGRIGRPPKLLSSVHATSSQPFNCTACGEQCSNATDFNIHSCNCNNNTIGLRSGSKTLAEMAAKISDKLQRCKDDINHVCQSCGRSFYNKLELDKHVETHVDDLMEDMLWT